MKTKLFLFSCLSFFYTFLFFVGLIAFLSLLIGTLFKIEYLTYGEIIIYAVIFTFIFLVVKYGYNYLNKRT